MTDTSKAIVAPLARWSCRIALFSVSLLLVGLILHRLTSFPTPVALNLFMVGYVGAALAGLIGLAALAQIWRTGVAGASSAAAGVLLPLVALAGPVAYVAAAFDLPRINDVTTDWTTPPQFTALAKRPDGTNSTAYPGEPFADQQAKAYPDLRTLVMDRSVDEAFELVEEVVKRLRWRVTASDAPAPGKQARVGMIEAVDHTLLVGFADDVVVRVEGSATRARIDVRSASRYGKFDFGQNAQRVRKFLAELQTRAEVTGPGGVAGRRAARTRALLKRQKAGGPQKAESRNARGRVQSDAPRGPGQRETLR